jgi:hypothetical protein
MRKVRVGIDISQFMQRRQITNVGWREIYLDTRSTFDELSLEVCTEIVATRARGLCEVLQTCVPGLSAVEIDWVDDYTDAVRESELLIRAVVLLPFTELIGVKVRVRKLVMSGSGQAEVKNIINQVLRCQTT